MSVQTNYVKLGLFVLVSLTLVVAGLIILGGGALWRDRINVETYLDESAQGLELGSVVKMRGVQVGNIQTISFVYVKYPEAYDAGQRYVLVEIGLYPDRFGDFPREAFKDLLAMEVAGGLRVRIAPQGLTGSAYLELDYADPLRTPTLLFDWQPELPYIPSAPGTITRFEETFESVSKTLSNLEAINLGQPVERLENLLVALFDKVDAVRTDLISEEAVALLAELRQTNARFARLLGDMDLDPDRSGDLQTILADISRTMHEVRALAVDVSSWVHNDEGGLDDLRMTVADIRRAAAQAPDMLDTFSGAAASGRESFDQLQQLVRQLRMRLAFQQEQLETLLRNLEQSSQNLREITDDARSYPSRLFFGEPPQASDPKEP